MSVVDRVIIMNEFLKNFAGHEELEKLDVASILVPYFIEKSFAMKQK